MPDFSPIPNITSIENTDLVRVWRYVDDLGGYRMFEIYGADLNRSLSAAFPWDLNTLFET